MSNISFLRFAIISAIAGFASASHFLEKGNFIKKNSITKNSITGIGNPSLKTVDQLRSSSDGCNDLVKKAGEYCADILVKEFPLECIANCCKFISYAIPTCDMFIRSTSSFASTTSAAVNPYSSSTTPPPTSPPPISTTHISTTPTPQQFFSFLVLLSNITAIAKAGNLSVGLVPFGNSGEFNATNNNYYAKICSESGIVKGSASLQVMDGQNKYQLDQLGFNPYDQISVDFCDNTKIDGCFSY